MITSRKQYPQRVPNKKPYRNMSMPATASALFASSKNRNQTCTFCRGQHLQYSATLLLISEKEGIFSGDKVVAIFA